MKKDFLKGISKENKKEFLSKLQSGKFSLLQPYEPQPRLSFDLQENGLYKCKETGKELTSQEIECLPGYRHTIELVSNKQQVNHEKPPSGIVLIPFTQQEYLNSLLKNKSDVVLTFDETEEKKPFKSDTDSYSFKDLMRINHDSPEIDFVMDEKTKIKYLECLENWS